MIQLSIKSVMNKYNNFVLIQISLNLVSFQIIFNL